MADLRTLLHDSAPEPSAPLDMAAVRRRAQRTGMRRLAAWLAGLGAIVGIGFPVGGSILVNADQSEPPRVDRVTPETVQGAKRVTTGTSVVEPDGDGAPPPGATRVTSRPAQLGGATTTSPPAASKADGDVEPSVVANAEARDYPPAAYCAVDNVGLGADQSRSCRFTATARGGGTVKSTSPVYPPPGIRAQMRITRNGETNTYMIGHQRVQAGDAGTFYCGAMIEPGDLVEVILTNSPAPDGSTSTAGAGDGWECWND